MKTKYGLHVESSFDPKSANMVTLTVKEGEKKVIERTVPGLLVVKLEEGSEFMYTEKITAPGIYHTYVYIVGKNCKVKLKSTVRATGAETDLAHKIYLESDCGFADVECYGFALNDASIIYTSGIYIKDKTVDNTGKQQARFLSVGDSAVVSSIPEISSGTKEGAIEHGVSIKHISATDIEYLSMRGQSLEEGVKTITDSFIE